MQISGLTMRGSNEPQQKPPSLMFSRPGEAGPANRELKQKLQRLLREHDTDLMLVSSSLPDRFTDEGTTVETGRSMLEATVDCLVQVGRFLVVGVHLVGSKALATDQESPARTAASLLANDVAGLTAWPGADHLIDKTWWTAATRGGLKTLVSGTHLASLIDSPQAAQRVMGATQPELGGYMGLLLRAAKHAHAADAPKLLAVLGTLSKQLDATAQQLAKHDLLPDGGLMAPGASSLLFARVLQLCFNVAKAVAQVCGQLRNSGVSTDFLRRLDNGNNVVSAGGKERRWVKKGGERGGRGGMREAAVVCWPQAKAGTNPTRRAPLFIFSKPTCCRALPPLSFPPLPSASFSSLTSHHAAVRGARRRQAAHRPAGHRRHGGG